VEWFCNLVANTYLCPTEMKVNPHRRQWIATFLLLAAMAFALPRTWIHHCGQTADLHVAHDSDGDHDQLEHDTCSICDFAATPSLQTISSIVLFTPDWPTADEAPLKTAIATVPLFPTDLRGPPMV
jgi:hypothetical protein